MALPSLDGHWHQNKRGDARIYLLDVHDKDQPDAGLIAQLLIEQVESSVPDGQGGPPLEAGLQLFYEVIWRHNARGPAAKGHFQASYRRGFGGEETVSLTGSRGAPGTVFLDPEPIRGLRIGTYLMNQVVTWALRWPEANVCPIRLNSNQGYEENRARRNRFYEQFGIVFNYRDDAHSEGTSQTMKVRELRQVDTWQQNIQERDVRDGLAMLRLENERLALELNGRLLALDHVRNELGRAHRHPLRWALLQMWKMYAPSHSQVFLVLLAVGLVWWQFKS